jgi:hypothetical protein
MVCQTTGVAFGRDRVIEELCNLVVRVDGFFGKPGAFALKTKDVRS